MIIQNKTSTSALRATLTALTVACALALGACGGGNDSQTAVSAAALLANTGGGLITGTGLPAASAGADGAFYLDTSTGRLFGPKGAGVWPAASLLLAGPAGPVGLAGTVGPAGTNGAPGATGATGATGPAGTSGATGATGASGAPGAAGPTGTTGATGATGAAGTAGATGATGATGPAGPAGATGATGPAGAAGLAGSSLYSGAGAPSAAFGKDGDFYLNTTDRSVYGPKAGGVWPVSGTSLVGQVGPAGVAGAPGTNGTNGTPGAAGTSLLSGSAPPTNAVGGVGDFYINTGNNTLIGPKSATSWPAVGTSLVGPQGAAGVTGPTGSTGATGAQGAAGTPGIAGSTGPAGAAGATGSTGATGAPGSKILTGTATPPPQTDGIEGDFYFNTASKTLIGPKTTAGWPLLGTSLTGLAGPQGAQGPAGVQGPQGIQGPASSPVKPYTAACRAGDANIIEITELVWRTIFCDFEGGNPGGEVETTVTLILPPARKYEPGTVITYRTTGTTFSSSSNKGVPSLFIFQSAESTYTGYSRENEDSRNNVDTTTGIKLINGEGALLSVMAVGDRWYQISP